tara:strand:+ start:409 stop:822 length:414 start_codon:yes stop_codon:yes gene_type:complete
MPKSKTTNRKVLPKSATKAELSSAYNSLLANLVKLEAELSKTPIGAKVAKVDKFAVSNKAKATPKQCNRVAWHLSQLSGLPEGFRYPNLRAIALQLSSKGKLKGKDVSNILALKAWSNTKLKAFVEAQLEYEINQNG